MLRLLRRHRLYGNLFHNSCVYIIMSPFTVCIVPSPALQYSIQWIQPVQMSTKRQFPDVKDASSRETQTSLSQPVAPDSDAVLAAGMVRHDPDALEELYRLYAPRLLVFLINRLGDRSLAEETLQEVMLSAWKGAPRFRGECRLYTWLLAIARNHASNVYHRQLKLHQGHLSLEADEFPLPAQDAAPDDQLSAHAELQVALEALSYEQRETLELVFYHGLSLEETARVLGVAHGTVKSRLHRARQRLRHLLGA
jgi:RNA polymerase sigma-70 factor, ECF subfamily